MLSICRLMLPHFAIRMSHCLALMLALCEQERPFKCTLINSRLKRLRSRSFGLLQGIWNAFFRGGNL